MKPVYFKSATRTASTQKGAAFVCFVCVCVVFVFAGYFLESNHAGLSKRVSSSLHKTLLFPVETVTAVTNEFSNSLNKQNFFSKDVINLELLIAPQHFEKLRNKRNSALKYKILVSNQNDEVPAYLKITNKEHLKVTVRLKGDWTDHLEGERWSFRVKVLKGHTIMGMRKFSLQRPEVRGGHGEGLLLRHLRSEGIIAPRYVYVNMFLNKKHFGSMVIEEHFSKELLESQGRKESLIYGFDESYVWKQRLLNKKSRQRIIAQSRSNLATLLEPVEFSRKGAGHLGGFFSAPFRIYQVNRILGKPSLHTAYRESLGLLRGYQNGLIPSEDVFDMEKMGKYMAIMHVWNISHGFYWTNVRLYYNPITRLLEPIGFDNDVGMDQVDLKHPFKKENPRDPDGPIFPAFNLLTSSDRFLSSYNAMVLKLAREIESGAFVSQLKKWEEPLVEKFGVTPYPTENFKVRIQELLRQVPNKLSQETITPFFSNQTVIPEAVIETFLIAYYIEEDHTQYLEFQNLTSQNVTLDTIYQKIHKRPLAPIILPKDKRIIPPRLKVEHRVRIPVPRLSSLKDRYQIVATLNGSNTKRDVPVKRYFPMLKAAKYGAPQDDELLARFPFLKIIGKNEYLIRQGTWEVLENMILPFGGTLHIKPGTTVRFAQGVRIVVRGGFIAEGTKESPILLTSLPEQKWAGIVVLGNQDFSSIKNTKISNIATPHKDDWGLTGAVTIHESGLIIQNTIFTDNTTEDALNIVRSTFEIKSTRIENTTSDGIDIDYGTGTMQGVVFANIGGDALDISGTTLTAQGLTIQNVYDKALSIGEGSRFTGSSITIQNAGTAIASKDGSKANLADSVIRDIQGAAYMSYIKKNEYKGSQLTIQNTNLENFGSLSAAIFPSIIHIDGEKQESMEILVSELYATGRMKK